MTAEEWSEDVLVNEARCLDCNATLAKDATVYMRRVSERARCWFTHCRACFERRTRK